MSYWRNFACWLSVSVISAQVLVSQRGAPFLKSSLRKKSGEMSNVLRLRGVVGLLVHSPFFSLIFIHHSPHREGTCACRIQMCKKKTTTHSWSIFHFFCFLKFKQSRDSALQKRFRKSQLSRKTGSNCRGQRQHETQPFFFKCKNKKSLQIIGGVEMMGLHDFALLQFCSRHSFCVWEEEFGAFAFFFLIKNSKWI